ncbi:hypothetical protein TNCV_186231 [Trichonephila clavipes]|nr:hypothetical protein TNCV_186231 [Trichonephila clavipes]
MKDIQIKIGYTYLLMALQQLPLVGLGELVLSSTPLILKNLLVPGQTILMILKPQLRPRVLGYNLFPSKLEFECKQFINSFLCAGREIVLIEAFMEMNKPTSWPKRLRRCIHLAFRNAKRLLRDKVRQKRISTRTNLAVGKSWSCLLDVQRRAELSALPRVEASNRFKTGTMFVDLHTIVSATPRPFSRVVAPQTPAHHLSEIIAAPVPCSLRCKCPP